MAESCDMTFRVTPGHKERLERVREIEGECIEGKSQPDQVACLRDKLEEIGDDRWAHAAAVALRTTPAPRFTDRWMREEEILLEAVIRGISVDRLVQKENPLYSSLAAKWQSLSLQVDKAKRYSGHQKSDTREACNELNQAQQDYKANSIGYSFTDPAFPVALHFFICHGHNLVFLPPP